MRSSILFYLAGLAMALLGALQPFLPLAWWAALPCALGLLWQRTRALAAVGLGVLGGSWHIDNYLADRASVIAAGELVQISAPVLSFARPTLNGGWTYQVAYTGARRLLPAPRIELSDHRAGSAPRPGDWCVLYVRLRRAHALANPGARDRERSYVAQRIVALGTVIAHPANLCQPIAPRWHPARARSALSHRIDLAVVDRRGGAVIRALVVADRSALDERQRELVRATGTGHLLAISGLHVSLCASWVLLLARWPGALPGVRWQGYSALRLAWLAALIAACAYAALAGFGVPARRAACMVAIAALAALRGRRILSWDNLLYALLLLAVVDPLCLLAEGSWLSFVAVALLVLFAGHGRGGRRERLRQAWRIHVILALGLAPISALVFGEVSLIAPLANLVAVPWCTVLVVPLALAGGALSAFGETPASVLWDMAARLWLLLERYLALLAALDWRLDARSLISARSVVPLMAALWLLSAPPALRGRALAVLVLVAMLLLRDPPVASGEVRVTVFDVGQGLAILVRTRERVLLYDAGPSWWGAGSDAGAAVVVPALARAGIKRIDRLVISHADGDHAGGLRAVLAALEVTRVLAPAGSALDAPVEPCASPGGWRWNAIEFRWLHPPVGASGSRNDQSCVLLIAAPHGRVLLAGDIEQVAERELLERYAEALKVDVLIVPHHGSRTSSTAPFVAATRPALAVISAGQANRYGLPHAQVVQRYREAGARVVNTASAGALSISLAAHAITLERERDRRRGFWSQLDLRGE